MPVYTQYMDRYEVYFTIEVWNEGKDQCGFATRRLHVPFQPHTNMRIKFRLGEFCFTHVVWDMTAQVFEATAQVVAGWDDEKFLDVHYFMDEFRRDEWNIIHPRPRQWPHD